MNRKVGSKEPENRQKLNLKTSPRAIRTEKVLGIFLDSETNGLNILKHKMIEIAFKILDISTGDTVDAFHSVIAITSEDWEKSDPGEFRRQWLFLA